MKKRMSSVFISLITIITLSSCGFMAQQLTDKANEERLLKPGALDASLTGVNDTYQYNFLDRYRVTHQWPRNSNGCGYAMLPTLGVKDGFRGEFWAVSDIYEAQEHTWQRGDKKPYFDRYVRSVRVMNPVVYDKLTRKRIEGASEEIETGLQPICLQSWYVTSHYVALSLFKWDVNEWKTRLSKLFPNGQWSQERVEGNLWTVQAIPEDELLPRKPNAAGGGFLYWILPIGDSGYTITLQLGASKESLQYPEAHARMKSAFRRLIESVRIDPSFVQSN